MEAQFTRADYLKGITRLTQQIKRKTNKIESLISKVERVLKTRTFAESEPIVGKLLKQTKKESETLEAFKDLLTKHEEELNKLSVL